MPYPAVPAFPSAEETRRALRQSLQASRTRAYCKIMVNGKDVTSAFDPYLISVQVIDKLSETDEAKIELDDRNAQLEIPPPKSPITVDLGWQKEGMHRLFSGLVMEVESGFGRKQGGRRLWLDCKGFDTSGPAKEPAHWYKGEGQPPEGQAKQIPLKEAFSEVAGNAGFIGTVSASLGNVIQRDYWSMNGESFLHWGARMAMENGLFFKVHDVNKASLTDVRDDRNASGEAMAAILAEWGVNLISWRIKPFVARPYWSGTGSSWFDIAQGVWKQLQSQASGGGPFTFAKAQASRSGAAPNARVGEQWAEGMAGYAGNERSQGHVLINGEPTARAKGTCVVWGARPGVDARYSIQEAEHTYTRGGGYVTRCTLRRGVFAEAPAYWARPPAEEPARPRENTVTVRPYRGESPP